jgi:hypothetical protein
MRCAYRDSRFPVVIYRDLSPSSENSGVHAAAVTTLIPASRRRVASLGGVGDGEDLFPQTDGEHLSASRIFFAALTSLSCLSPQALHTHALTTSMSRAVGPVRA